MSHPWVTVLYSVSGICLYASVLHAQMGLRRPGTAHLLFAALAVMVALFVVAKAATYAATSQQELVALRRREVAFGIVIFAILPWFVDRYLGRPRRWVAPILSAVLTVLLIANLVLPWGISFVRPPTLGYMALPWGETVVDVREHELGIWNHALWMSFFLVLLYCVDACARRYKEQRHRATVLGLAITVFLVFMVLARLSLRGVIGSPPLAEFGFLALLLVMSHALISEFAHGERLMRQVLDQVPAVVYLKDLHGRYQWVNRHFEALTGISSLAATDKTDAELFPATVAERLRANDHRVLESRRPEPYEETVTVPDGFRAYASLKFPLLDGDGIPFAVACVSTDITEKKKSEQEIRQLRERAWYADRVARLGVLNASIAHELNQPLAAILLNSQAGLRFLARGALAEGEARQILEDIARDTKRAGGVISGMRSLIRKQQTPRASVDLTAMVEEVLALMHNEMTERDVRVVTTLCGGCVAVVDKAQLQQVIINLTMNALDAMREEPAHAAKLHVSVRRCGDREALVAIRDWGPGVPAERMDKLFEAFNTSKSQGLGMGLSICRSIIESHGGNLRADRNDDRGMTFSFTVPCAPAADEAGKPSLSRT